MKYLLDTNILSETLRVQPHTGVKKWREEVPSETLFITALSLGEIRRSVEKVENCKRKNDLITWLEHELPRWFGVNVLPVTLEVAERWGYITSTVVQRPLMTIDTLLAATALAHNLKVVTRNVKNFVIPGLEVINPFEL